LGKLFAAQGNLDGAVRQYLLALRSDPSNVLSRIQLAGTLSRQGRLHEAEVHFREARRLAPSDPSVCSGLGLVLQGQEKIEEALRCYEESLRLRPDQPQILNNLAWFRATHPDPKLRDGAQAVAAAERAVKLLRRDVSVLDTLAAAYAEAGRFPEALQTAQQALELAAQQNKQALAESIKAKLLLYTAGHPFRDARSTSAPTPTPP
jgi:Flp pilus assembly protein TadD